MSTQQVIAFWQKVQGDEQLQEEIRTASGGGPLPELGDLCRIAANAGFECTPEELDAVEDVVRFWDWVNEGDRIQERLESAQEMDSHDETLNEIVRIAKEAGFIFTADQLDSVTRVLFEASRAQGQALTDDDLDHVAGGVGVLPGQHQRSFMEALNGGWARRAGGRPFQAISF